jgi:hypothetical protein
MKILILIVHCIELGVRLVSRTSVYEPSEEYNGSEKGNQKELLKLWFANQRNQNKFTKNQWIHACYGMLHCVPLDSIFISINMNMFRHT